MKRFLKKWMILTAVLSVVGAVSVSAGGNGEPEPEVVSSGPAAGVQLETAALSWEVDGDDIIFTLEAETTGWISVGFNPSQVMKDAQFVIGYVQDGETFIRDDFGNGRFSHAPDTELGGTDDVRLISGGEENGWTRLVFALPIDSSDSRDVPLTLMETHKILIAYGPDNRDDFRTKHSFRTSFEAVIE